MDIETISLRRCMATVIIRADLRVTNNHQAEPTLPCRPVRGAVRSEERPRDLQCGGCRGRGHVCGDRTVHGSQWPSVSGRPGAVDGLLHHVGGARLRIAMCWNSRNIQHTALVLEDGLSFLLAV